MATISPFSGSSTAGTADRGARSEVVRARPGRRGGELDRMPVLEVGTGVGYLSCAFPVCWRFNGRGRAGEEERGSNGGSNEGAGRFVPAKVEDEEERAAPDVVGGSVGSLATGAAVRGGDESIMNKKKTGILVIKGNKAQDHSRVPPNNIQICFRRGCPVSWKVR